MMKWLLLPLMAACTPHVDTCLVFLGCTGGLLVVVQTIPEPDHDDHYTGPDLDRDYDDAHDDADSGDETDDEDEDGHDHADHGDDDDQDGVD